MAQTVLVADDSVASQRLFEMVLNREGFEVVTVGSGQDILDKVKEKQPDLALIDAVMPGVDGYQICQSLKKDPQLKGLPVIMLAGTYEDVDRQRGASIVGANAVLDKPATSQVIIAKVKELLAAQQAEAAPKSEIAEVVEEPSFVEEEYEFDEDSEEVDLAVESELLEEEAEWEEPDEDLDDLSEDAADIDDVFEDVAEPDEIEAVEEFEDADVEDAFEDEMFENEVFEDEVPAAPQDIAEPSVSAAPAPAAQIPTEQLDAAAEAIAQRVAAKLGPILVQSLTAYVLQTPAIRQIIDETSKRLVQEILPDIQDSL